MNREKLIAILSRIETNLRREILLAEIQENNRQAMKLDRLLSDVVEAQEEVKKGGMK